MKSVIDATASADVMLRLARAMKNTRKESITPNELVYMAKIIVQRAEFRS